MAALDFPSSPTVGQVYTANGKSWQWDGVSWISYNTLIAAGSNTQIQFNNSGAFGASAGLTWNGTTLTTTGLNNTGNTTLGDASGDTLTIHAGTTTFTQGTANGVLYLNGSKVATSGSALTFDGTNLVLGGAQRINGTSTSGLTLTSSSGVTSGFKLYNDSGTDTAYLMNNYNGAIVFGITNTEQARITSKGLLVDYTSDSGLSGPGNAIFSGSVGIGTSSPGAELDVQGAGAVIQLKQNVTGAATYYVMDNTVETGGKRWRFGYSGGAGIPCFSLLNETNNLLAWAVDASGNLGLGVTPKTWIGGVVAFELTNNGSLWSYGQGASAQLGLMNNAYINTSGQYIRKMAVPASSYYQSGSSHYWYTDPSSGSAGSVWSPTQAMTLDASGNLVVGDTTAPVTTRTYFKGSATSNSTWSIYAANSAGTVQFGLRNDNYFYAPSIGGYPTTGTTVVVNGNYLGYLSSSLRFKKDIVDYDKGLTEILALRPVYYKSKNPNPDGQYDEQRYAGLIAEEIAELGFDEFVINGPDGQINSIQYGNMVALCIKAIQELTAELNELKQRIA